MKKLAVALLAFTFASLTPACTKQQGQQVKTDIEVGLSVADKACVIGEEVLPLFGLPQPTIAEVQKVCGLEAIASQDIEQFIAASGPGIEKARVDARAKLAAQKTRK